MARPVRDEDARIRLFPPPHPLSGAQWAGLRVGLLGGSFNPPHAGHRHIAMLALKRFNLDAVWWLVSPGNPLKSREDLLPLPQRLAQVRQVADHPLFIPCALETALGTARTFDTNRLLKRRFPRTHFLWLCGMDNALIFHRWHRWREVAAQIPIVFIARPPLVSSVQTCPIRLLATGSAQIRWLLDVPTTAISSTALRQAMPDLDSDKP